MLKYLHLNKVILNDEGRGTMHRAHDNQKTII